MTNTEKQTKAAMVQCRVMVIALLLGANTGHAHEYWLDPVAAKVEPGAAVILDVRNGDEFAGSGMPFQPQRYEKITIAGQTKAGQNSVTRYKGRIGDYPAIHTTLDSVGVHSITLTTKPMDLNYKSWDKFANFLSYHDLTSVVENEDPDSYPLEDIMESYRRYTRAFVQVAGTDSAEAPQPENITEHAAFAARGDAFEMILLNNPFANTDEVVVRLLKNEKPVVGRQAEMFWKGSFLLRFTEHTNKEGIATFKLPGNGEYLLNAVYLEASKDYGVDWESQWASITFEVDR